MSFESYQIGFSSVSGALSEGKSSADNLFAQFSAPDEILQLDALPGMKPGVIP
jgi:hypothetical protein